MPLRRILLLSFIALPAFMNGSAVQAQSLTTAGWATGVRPDDRASVNYRTVPYVQTLGLMARRIDSSPRMLLTEADTLAVRSGTSAHSSRALHVVYGLLIGAATGWGTGIVLDRFLNRNSSRSCGGCDHIYYTAEVLTVPAGVVIGGIVGVLLPTR